MIQLFSNISRRVLSGLLGLFYTFAFLLSPIGTTSAYAADEGINVILMIGDGMGWEAARAAAIAKGGRPYSSGKGSGLSMQTLSGYTYATAYGTTIPAPISATNPALTYGTGNSALTGSDPVTGKSPVRPGFTFNPALNPGSATPSPQGTTRTPCQNGAGTTGNGGNIVGYEPAKGGPNPWTPLSPATAGAYDKEYIKCSYPDSANTASTLYTGVKSYNNAMGVDIYEKASVRTILQTASKLGKSTGVVSSVPLTHATPGAAVSSVNRRSKYDSEFPLLDSILQQAIRPDLPDRKSPDRPDVKKFLPTVMLGGGHPLDFQNTTNQSTVQPADSGYTFIKKSTYDQLKSNNPYGYTFLERDVNVTTTNDLRKIKDGGNELLAKSRTLDPNKGDRLLGLYGARGQNGNLPFLTANRDYSATGLDAFNVFSTAVAGSSTTSNGPQVPKPDTIRPLASGLDNGKGETPEQFIAKEVKANPTLAEMTRAALNVLGKDKDGFWLMVEGGDVDWSLHDDNMDNLIGTMFSFDDAVKTTINWINNNGGWKKNVLIVTADHDHYLTLNNNFPELLGSNGAEALTYAKHTPSEAGHFFGSEPGVKYGWGNHSNRMVPVYYQGDSLELSKYIGKPVEFVDSPSGGGVTKVYSIPGVPTAVDQSHIYKAMLKALKR